MSLKPLSWHYFWTTGTLELFIVTFPCCQVEGQPLKPHEIFPTLFTRELVFLVLMSGLMPPQILRSVESRITKSALFVLDVRALQVIVQSLPTVGFVRTQKTDTGLVFLLEVFHLLAVIQRHVLFQVDEFRINDFTIITFNQI